MRWPFRRPQEPAARLPHAFPVAPPPHPRHGVSDDDAAALMVMGFCCTTCGRTDLPPAGDWDPPICLECDAAINFDEEREATVNHDAEDEAVANDEEDADDDLF
jgi:hypothetical protein